MQDLNTKGSQAKSSVTNSSALKGVKNPASAKSSLSKIRTIRSDDAKTSLEKIKTTSGASTAKKSITPSSIVTTSGKLGKVTVAPIKKTGELLNGSQPMSTQSSEEQLNSQAKQSQNQLAQEEKKLFGKLKDTVQKRIKTKTNGRKARKASGKGAKKGLQHTSKVAKSSIKMAPKMVKSAKTVYAQISKAASKVVAAVSKVIAQAAASLSASPVGIAVLAGILCAIPFLFLLSAIGSNDSGKEDICSTNTVSDGSIEQNKRAIWNFFQAKGLSEPCIAGFMGNVQQECGFDPSQIQNNDFVHGGIGLIQWTDPSFKNDLLSYASKKDKEWFDLDLQLDYIWNNILDKSSPNTGYGGGTYKQSLINAGFFDAQDPVEATVIFHNQVERSADTPSAVQNVRGGYAQEVYNLYSGTSGTTQTVEPIIWVGDSRFVGMMQTVKDEEDYVVAKSAQGYDWFINEGLSLVNQNLDKADKIVFNLGVNDLSNVDKYIDELNSLAATDWKDKEIIYMSLNPVDDSISQYVKNSDITKFNSRIKEKLSTKITFLDTNSKLEDLNFDSEGIHYDEAGYKKIYGLVRGERSNACDSYGTGFVDGYPDFSNRKAWIDENLYAKSGLYGQCTYYTCGCCLQFYGHLVEWPSGDGNTWVGTLVSQYPEYFKFSTTPVTGSIYSTGRPGLNHVGFVIQADGDTLTIFEGNFDGLTNSWPEVEANAVTVGGQTVHDWEVMTVDRSYLETNYGAVFANPTQKALAERNPVK